MATCVCRCTEGARVQDRGSKIQDEGLKTEVQAMEVRVMEVWAMELWVATSMSDGGMTLAMRVEKGRIFLQFDIEDVLLSPAQ